MPQVSEVDVQQAYAALAPLYIDRLGSLEIVHPDDLAILERLLGDVRGPVADLGCGPGHLTDFLRGLGCDVTGIDPVAEFVDHARRTYPEARFAVGSVTDLAQTGVSADGSWAGVLAWYSLIHHTPAELEQALTTIRRSLRAGGTLVVGFFTGVALEPFEHKVVTAYRWPVDELAERLAAVGFTEVERLTRDQDGERRPHGVIAARAEGAPYG